MSLSTAFTFSCCLRKSTMTTMTATTLAPSGRSLTRSCTSKCLPLGQHRIQLLHRRIPLVDPLVRPLQGLERLHRVRPQQALEDLDPLAQLVVAARQLLLGLGAEHDLGLELVANLMHVIARGELRDVADDPGELH